MRLFKRNYRIILDDEAWVEPEEAIIDSNSSHTNVEKPIDSYVFSWFLFSIISLCVVIASFVFKMSVFENQYFSKLAVQNKVADFPLSPPRGIIFDISGEPLVKNIPIFRLLGVTREIKQSGDKLKANLSELSRILNIPFDILRSEVDNDLRSNAIFFVAEGLDKDQALQIEYLGPTGFYIVSETKREYISGHKFSSILGYTGKVNKDDLDDSDYYFPTDRIGRLGIESQYEDTLRGEHGNIFFTSDNSASQNKNPVPGKSIVLNIDSGAQEKLHDSLWNVLLESGLSRAAAVVQNPKNGAVIALISFPTYDNNIFESGVSDIDFKNLFQSRSRPLFNRIISGNYNPGSTIKPFIGMTALQEGVVDANDTIQDCISISIGDFTFGNWREERGIFDLKKAIANSCNIYFYSVGGGYGNIRGLGVTKISDYLKKGMADSILGIDLPGEVAGFVPTPAWKLETRGESWYLGDTYNISIGQGDLSVTPLWLNTYISAVANSGTIFQPRVINRIIDSDKKPIQIFETKEIAKLPFSPGVIEQMQSAMRETVLTGTAKLLNNLSVNVAAKTGTAEVIKGQSTNALFTAFAPYEDPEVAITILIEGAPSTGGFSTRVAHDFLSWYFSRDKDESGNPIP